MCIRDRPETPERREVPVAHPDPQQGLTSAQVRERADAGWTNAPVDPPGKTVKQDVYKRQTIARSVIAAGSARKSTLRRNFPLTRLSFGSMARMNDGMPMVTALTSVSCAGLNGYGSVAKSVKNARQNEKMFLTRYLSLIHI